MVREQPNQVTLFVTRQIFSPHKLKTFLWKEIILKAFEKNQFLQSLSFCVVILITTLTTYFLHQNQRLKRNLAVIKSLTASFSSFQHGIGNWQSSNYRNLIGRLSSICSKQSDILCTQNLTALKLVSNLFYTKSRKAFYVTTTLTYSVKKVLPSIGNTPIDV